MEKTYDLMSAEIIATNFVAGRTETPSRYDANEAINKQIMATFKKSVEEFNYAIVDWHSYYLPDFPEMRKFDESTDAGLVGDLPYGRDAYVPGCDLSKTTTIREKGSAVVCLDQGLRTRYTRVAFDGLVKEVSLKGYYQPGKGTWRVLFDRVYLRRATHARELVEAASLGHLVTALVELEPGKRGYVNMVAITPGADKHYAAVLDIPGERRCAMQLETFMEAIDFAWIW